jgi:GNAT superfamily N-acetyltransferase
MSDATPALRIDAAQLLTQAPADALTSYFALEHDAKRTKLYVRTDASGRTLAFVGVCQTGIDLFRPLIVLRGDDSAALRDALQQALVPKRQYLISAPPALQPDLAAVGDLSGESISNVLTLNRADFQPVLNMLAVSSKTPDGMLRASIAARDGTNAAESGTSWISSRYGEVYVQVLEGARRRGLGKSVVSAVSNDLLAHNKTPLYVTRIDNIASRKLAERVGYKDSGMFELSGAIMRT